MIQHSRPSIVDRDIVAVMEQMRGGMIAEGAAVAKLERDLAEAYGFAHAVAVGSGCQALLLALRLRGATPHARVVMPTYVCPEVLGVVEELGAEPFLVDVAEDYVVDLASAHAAAADAANAILIAPDMFGQQIDPERFDSFAGPVILDYAQTLPFRRPARVGAPRLAILSFEATKGLAGGEGGAILVDAPADAEILRGMKRLTRSDLRLNLFPMSDLQAALVSSQLGRCGDLISRRKEIVARYDAALFRMRCFDWIRRPPIEALFRYVVTLTDLAPNADELIAAFAGRDVSVRRPVAPLLHHVRPASATYPVAQLLFERTLSLPLYPALDDRSVDRVIEAATEILQ